VVPQHAPPKKKPGKYTEVSLIACFQEEKSDGNPLESSQNSSTIKATYPSLLSLRVIDSASSLAVALILTL